MENSHPAGSLLDLLAQIPDPRGHYGRRHPLAAMLTAIVCAILTGARGYRTIAQWTRSQDANIWQKLGFYRRPPCANCFRDLLMVLDPAALEAVLRHWMANTLKQPVPDEIQPVAMDGKTLCNTMTAHQRNVQLLSLLDHATGSVLSQQSVPQTTNEAKTAVELLMTIVLKGRLITGDAMFCQRELCQQIVDSGGHYLFVVKDNQPELKAAIEAEFEPGFSPRYGKTTTSVAV